MFSLSARTSWLEFGLTSGLSVLAAVVVSLGVLGCDCGSGGTTELPVKAAPQAADMRIFPAPALVAEETRHPGYDDFMRLVFADIKAPVNLGGPKAYRVFFSATAYYKPPITITQIANFSGIPVNSSKSLLAIRCMPPTSSEADPVLATWPNLIARIRKDYETNPPAPKSADAAIEAIADGFEDSANQVLTQSLAYSPEFGARFFEQYGSTSEKEMRDDMSMRFGTFPAFLGLGYSAEGTASSPSLNSQQTMESIATPEFILKNVSMLEAGCHCIEVPASVPKRDSLKLDPDFILTHDGNGTCAEANLWAEDDPL